MAYRSTPRDLGPLERRFASPRPVRGIMVMVGVFGLPGLVLLSGFQSAPGQVFAGTRETNTALGVALVGIALAFIVMIMRKATLSIALHENGLRWQEAGVTRDMFWDDIVEIRGAHTKRLVAGAEASRTHVYRLRLSTGFERVMTNMLEDVRVLAARIEKELSLRLVPKTRQRLEGGEMVTFGAIVLSKDAITSGDRTIAFCDLRRVSVENGVLRLEGPVLIEIEWSSIPNACVLLTMLEQR